MPADLESEAALVLVASLIRQLQVNNALGEMDIAKIFGHADDALAKKRTPVLDALWVRAQEIIAE
jgi:hypothetical protein